MQALTKALLRRRALDTPPWILLSMGRSRGGDGSNGQALPACRRQAALASCRCSLPGPDKLRTPLKPAHFRDTIPRRRTVRLLLPFMTQRCLDRFATCYESYH